MGRGILATLQLVGTAAVVVPVAFFGLSRLLAGEVLIGAAFLAFAAGMLLLEERLTTPSDLPVAAAERVTGRLVGTSPGTDASTETDADVAADDPD